MKKVIIIALLAGSIFQSCKKETVRQTFIASKLDTSCHGLIAKDVISPVAPGGIEIHTVYLNFYRQVSGDSILSCQTDTFRIFPVKCGVPPYTYTWQVTDWQGVSTTFSDTTGMYIYSPTSADLSDRVTTVTGTITDSTGSSVAMTEKFNVVDPHVPGGIQICHKVAVRGGSVTQLMVVPYNQVNVHLGHGDVPGNCTPFTGN